MTLIFILALIFCITLGSIYTYATHTRPNTKENPNDTPPRHRRPL